MRAQDTVHLRTLLYDEMDTALMHRFFDYWINRDAGARYAFPSRRVGGREIPWSGEQVCNDIQGTTRMAESWYVGEEVMSIVDAMRGKMPPEVMHQEDPPSTHGFLVFEKPWMQSDVRGKAMPIRAILWSTRPVGKTEYNTVRNGVAIWTLSDIDDRFLDDYWRPEASPSGGAKDETDRIVQNMVDQGCRFSPTGIFAVTFGAYAFTLADQAGTWLLANDSEQVQIEPDPEEGVWNVSLDIVGDDIPDQVLQVDKDALGSLGLHRGDHGSRFGAARLPRQHRVRTEPIVGFLQALWRFQQQELTSIERPHLPRTMRRHLERRNMLNGPISIIHWRKRAQGPERGDREYELTHRFVVRGHWRRQWYPSEQRHKSIYIAPYLKGPDDAPILMRERVNAIVR